MVLVGLVAAAVMAGSAAASMPVPSVFVHARLVPITGASSSGRFSGLLAKARTLRAASSAGSAQWHLSWRVGLPALRSPARALLRLPARNGAAPAVLMLCNPCTSTTTGALVLDSSQAIRLAQSQATVVVLAPSTTLRGAVKAQAILPKPQG
jgi:hypothetical protein